LKAYVDMNKTTMKTTQVLAQQVINKYMRRDDSTYYITELFTRYFKNFYNW